jgi:hypothetical protein
MAFAEALLGLLIDPPHAPWHVDWAVAVPLIVLTVILHVLGLGIIQHNVLRFHAASMRNWHTVLGFALVMGVATLFAACLHAIEAAIWGMAYLLIDALPNVKIAMLYSLGAMTTYGHENLHVEPRWQLLGAVEALSGWLLFGLTTALLFSLMNKISGRSD